MGVKILSPVYQMSWSARQPPCGCVISQCSGPSKSLAGVPHLQAPGQGVSPHSARGDRARHLPEQANCGEGGQGGEPRHRVTVMSRNY